jgi:hypothetical protein
MAMVDLSGQTVAFPTLLFNGFLNFLRLVTSQGAIDSFLHREVAVQAYSNIKNSVYSAPDYTNMGFFGHVFADTGYMYVVTAIVYGCLIGLAYKGFRQYQTGWMAMYPIVFISLLESYRIPYLFETRTFYPLLYLGLRFVYLSYVNKTGIRAGAVLSPDLTYPMNRES